LTNGSVSSIFNLMVEYTITPLDKTFHALAHPIRREMLAHLTHKRFTVLEMAQLFDLSLNGVSKHLKVLEQAGLIHREIQGRTHYCSLEAQRLREAAEWLDYYRHFWEGRLDALESFLERREHDKQQRYQGSPGGFARGVALRA
jgi:DNA-binding transcriptional ArsR family regulator